ncbi:MAG: type II toxin-antitoxin system RelE/ParE family toxin [Nitrospirae bacterium]|nr:type II toxin-antitoxin system RelE/ParE family toxin [Nitrospirota bacterium]MBF0521362.1 type II toxin-antitoxin system RelE/ParE family toxin [Nitrospirota bacterium]
MGFSVVWSNQAYEELSKFDVKTKTRIVDKVDFYLSDNPVRLSKPLKGLFNGLYSYRFGKIRIVFALNERDNTITVTRVAFRKNVYE